MEPMCRVVRRPRGLVRASLLLAAIALQGCGSHVTPVVDCAPGADITPVCGFANPEDLAPFPPTGELLVSEYGGMDGGTPGRLSRFRPGTAGPEPLFPLAESLAEPRTGFRPDSDTDIDACADAGDCPPTLAASWGAADCPGPPDARFSPHGLDLERRDDGRWSLLVVNHGGRESVEFFEVSATSRGARLVWRGCVIAPGDEQFNDVVALRDGGFWVSHMYPRHAVLASTVKAVLGTPTGAVLHWRPPGGAREAGFRVLPGTAVRVANGIEKSADESELYLNEYVGGRVLRIDVDSGALLAEAAVPGPDNLAWDSDGRLLVASHDDDLGELLACDGLEAGACGFRFRILPLDARSLTPGDALVDQRGAPMGGATIAVRLADALWLGSFAGDRIGRVEE